MEKQQKQKEARAMERLHLLLPALGPTVRAVALEQCGWDEEKALTMLRRFQVGGAAAAWIGRGAARGAGLHGHAAACRAASTVLQPRASALLAAPALR